MRLSLVPDDGQEPAEVVLLELAECQQFIDQLRLLVDTHEQRINDALNWLPHERRQLPVTIPTDYLE